MSNTLHLSVHKQAFDVMVTGEKDREYRRPTDWIKSRLYFITRRKIHTFLGFYPRQTKELTMLKTYKYIRVVNGYGANRPYFIAEYKGFDISVQQLLLSYSNGLDVLVAPGDYIIKLGRIIEKGNLN